MQSKHHLPIKLCTPQLQLKASLMEQSPGGGTQLLESLPAIPVLKSPGQEQLQVTPPVSNFVPEPPRTRRPSPGWQDHQGNTKQQPQSLQHHWDICQELGWLQVTGTATPVTHPTPSLSPVGSHCGVGGCTGPAPASREGNGGMEHPGHHSQQHPGAHPQPSRTFCAVPGHSPQLLPFSL